MASRKCRAIPEAARPPTANPSSGRLRLLAENTAGLGSRQTLFLQACAKGCKRERRAPRQLGAAAGACPGPAPMLLRCAATLARASRSIRLCLNRGHCPGSILKAFAFRSKGTDPGRSGWRWSRYFGGDSTDYRKLVPGSEPIYRVAPVRFWSDWKSPFATVWIQQRLTARRPFAFPETIKHPRALSPRFSRRVRL